MRKIKGIWGVKVEGRTCLAPGAFDGLHVGHMSIIREMVSEAKRRGLTPVVMIIGMSEGKPLVPEDERDRILEEAGVELVILQDLDDGGFREMSPEEFARRVISEILKVDQVFVGADFRFGSGRSGDVRILSELGARYGFGVRTFELISVDGVIVKSSSIRRMIKEGDIEGASRLLGRRYLISGVVEKGDGRGEFLGFPTANLPNPRNMLPGEGVYAAMVDIGGRRMKGVAYVGRRPTFGGGEPILEVHIPGVRIPLLGKDISVEMVRRIRGDMRFERAEDLIMRIEKDVEEAMKILEEEAKG